MFADLFALSVGVGFSFLVQASVAPVSHSIIASQLRLIALSLPVFAVAASRNRMYHEAANIHRIVEASRVTKTIAAGMGWLLMIAVLTGTTEPSRVWVASLCIGLLVSGIIERRLVRRVLVRQRLRGRMTRRIIVVGADSHAADLVRTYRDNPALGYEVVGLVHESGIAAHDGIERAAGVEVLGRIDQLVELTRRHRAVAVIVSLNSVSSDTVNQLTREVTDAGFNVALSSSLRDIDVTRLHAMVHDGQSIIHVEPTLRNGWRSIAKRVFDLTLALTVLVATLPVMIAAVIAVAVTSPGPIFFRQTRVGKDGELFEVLKLRTMHVDAEQQQAALLDMNEADGPLFKMSDDPRVTKVGRFLRKSSIDELPQLFCVLIGTMSMVGPRPALPREVEQWDADVRDRLRVLPGITGMWQVSGRSDSSFETYKRMDLYYVDNWSLMKDLTICAKTVGVVLSGSGAS